jgi:hypothetical protein
MHLKKRHFSLITCLRFTVISAAIGLAFGLTGCSHAAKRGPEGVELKPRADGLKVIADPGKVELRLKADPKRFEKVAYFHKSASKSFEDNQMRAQKDENIEFSAQAETVKVDGERFTQLITVTSKDGGGDLHDFAMPEMGERLEVVTDTRGKILKSGDWPTNSIFYVSPISLPEGLVSVGDTWTMQASWLSLGEMVPYQLDMVSILKNVWTCGQDRCAEIEISGQVTLQGTIAQAMNFKSNWRGRIYFAIGAGTVVWSRVESEERLLAENVRRDINSCLESVLTEPGDVKLPGIAKPICAPLAPSQGTEL